MAVNLFKGTNIIDAVSLGRYEHWFHALFVASQIAGEFPTSKFCKELVYNLENEDTHWFTLGRTKFVMGVSSE